MDRNQERMQILSLFGIYKEAYKLLSSRKKIFNQIEIYLLLPLSFLLLSEVKLSNNTPFAIKIITGNKKSNILPHTSTCNNKPPNNFFYEVTNSWQFKVGYYTLILVLSSFSSASIVYTTACAYMGREVTFKKVKNAISKVWKRNIINFLCCYFTILIYTKSFQLLLQWDYRSFLYNLCDSLRSFGGCQTVAVSYSYHKTHRSSDQIEDWLRFLYNIGFINFLILLFVIGSVYASIIWRMASVVSVLEEEGSVIRALIKSKALIKGKIWINTAILLITSVLVEFTRGAYVKLFAHGSLIAVVSEVPFGIICFWFLCQLTLFGFTAQTVTYFVCKSYHNESIINLPALLDSLDHEFHPHDN